MKGCFVKNFEYLPVLFLSHLALVIGDTIMRHKGTKSGFNAKVHQRVLEKLLQIYIINM